jgi:hypothetical protein
MGRELKRVPVDFDWPVGETWEGFVNPHYRASKCSACDGSGCSPEAKRMKDEWYGYAAFDPTSTGSVPFASTDRDVVDFAARNLSRAPEYYGSDDNALICEAQRLADLFNSRWMHHLSQADVDALVEDNRLYDFTHTWTQGVGWQPKDPPYLPTAAEVNRWSLYGFGHDSINQWVVVSARCKREGVEENCPVCNGHGDIWPSEEEKRIYEAWTETEPPTGDGYQIWETVSEGSPVSPVFATPEELAQWMVENDDSVTKGTTYEQWMAFINGPGWAPSSIVDSSGVRPGVQACCT